MSKNSGMVIPYEKPEADAAYRRRIKHHPEGFVMNKTLEPHRLGALKLHHADCTTISDEPANGVSYVSQSTKYYASSLAELESYASNRWGAKTAKCGKCFP